MKLNEYLSSNLIEEVIKIIKDLIASKSIPVTIYGYIEEDPTYDKEVLFGQDGKTVMYCDEHGFVELLGFKPEELDRINCINKFYLAPQNHGEEEGDEEEYDEEE